MKEKLLTLILTILSSLTISAQTTYFVSNSGDDSNNGLSWATAKATINGAMALITSPNNDSVFVAVGTYPACTIKSSTHVYGGFAGTESHLYERQALTYGIASDSSSSVIDAQHSNNYAVSINGYMYYNNSYNCRPVDFDGFYVKGGNQYGVYSEANNTYTISNCTMTDNACGLYLGMSYSNSYYQATFKVSDCKISGNTTNGGVSMYSGGQTYGATYEFTNCVITENTGSVFGGMRFNAAYIVPYSTIIVNNCDITKNTASGLNAKAGGILTQSNNFSYNQTRNEWRIINSRIIDNIVYSTASTASSEDYRPYIAGGISIYTHSTHIIGSVIANNSAISTEGIDVTGGVVTYANGSTSSSYAGYPVGRLNMTNCVVTNNLAQTTNTSGTGGIRTTKAATVKNTVAVNNKRGGENSNLSWSNNYTLPYTYCACPTNPDNIFAADSTNIVLDSLTQPMFVAPSSMVGANTISTDYSNLNADWHVQPNSPLVDAGDPNTAFITYLPDTDMDGNPRIFNNIADIGAYECTQTTMSQAIIWNQTLSATLGDAPIKLTATATSGLPVSYSSSDETIAYLSNDTLFVVGVGAALITASQAGSTLYQPAADVSLILNVSAPVLDQSISWNQTLTANINDSTLELTATASSGLPVSYTCSDENIAIVNGNVLTLLGVGQAVITASQAGNAYYHPAPSVVKILTVNEAGGEEPQPQTISWEQNLSVNLSDGMLTLSATASSGLPVSYSCSDENVAIVNGNILVLTGVGQAIITASQAGNDNYLPAQNVMKVLNVTESTPIMQEQSISWNQELNVILSDAYLVLTATATSGLPVSYTCSDENVATVNGSVLLLMNAGQAIITASQSGNDNYYPAQNVMKILNVSQNSIGETPLIDATIGPNPTSGVINVQLTMNNEQLTGTKIQVFDIYGKVLIENKIEDSNFTIDLTEYPNGMYFIRLYLDNGQSSTLKVIKSA